MYRQYIYTGALKQARMMHIILSPPWSAFDPA